ncbi:hypothetical protein ACROYT_G018584 [Oculina patagonica]
MKFAWTTFLLVLLLVSTLDAARKRKGRKRRKGNERPHKAAQCLPTQEYMMTFPERTNTDYAIKENSIAYDLNAVTVCIFARDNPYESGTDNQCLYSYAVTGQHNELTVCTSPALRVLIQGIRRDADVGIDDGKWHHVCFTWSNTNGDYKFYKDGAMVGSGTGMNVGGKISYGGTTVIGQDQDEVGGGFDATQAFVGDVTELNVWSTVLSESDIVAQYSNCHVTQGSVN